MFKIRLRELREAANYPSQQSFADAFGVAQSTVAGWEAGSREPKHKTVLALARFFGVSADYLLGLSDDPTFSGSSLASFIRYTRGDESEDAFARKCGISVDLLHRIEAGFRRSDDGDRLNQANSLSTQDIRLIAEGINVDWEYIACLYAGYDPARLDLPMTFAPAS